jgi:hypothetical protein
VSHKARHTEHVAKTEAASAFITSISTQKNPKETKWHHTQYGGQQIELKLVAERGGFEPPVGYKPTHAFQACALNRSAISPANRGKLWRTHLSYATFFIVQPRVATHSAPVALAGTGGENGP